MRFSNTKKQNIILYLLEKIDQNQMNLTKHVAEEFGVAQNTIYTYLNELEKDNIIKKVKSGTYVLVDEIVEYKLSRKKDEIKNETAIYKKYVYDVINEYDKNVVSIWNYSFSEMINNVIEHSACKNVTLSIGRNYLNTWVKIYDDGVGIFDKIMNYFDLPTIDDAVCELFKGKLTTDSKNHSGEGIFFTSRMMDEFVICSSDKAFAVNKYDSDILAELSISKGTFLYMKLSNFTKKTTVQIFDLYSDSEMGFTKTRIPLKNMFDGDPVSRSQAKRVCNRLADFKNVVFDFDGIEWAGQGFMDQIFRVFQNDNPDIELIADNMCKEVENMYKHVKK